MAFLDSYKSRSAMAANWALIQGKNTAKAWMYAATMVAAKIGDLK